KKFKDEFEKKMKSDAFLIKEILDFRLKRFLENERQRNVQEILCLEKTFKTTIKFKEGRFRFKAVIDRIDRLDDQSILVLDYKTGGIDILPLIDIERIESAGLDRENLKDTIRSFQLPLYLYFVINDKNHRADRTNACLYSLREIDARTLGLSMLFKNDTQLANKEKIMRVYLRALGAIMEDILNPGIPFEADEEDARQCSNCPFFYMCR
ncbi:MAG: PD-(D/E)XK nuclease family protein, partial [Candidatus Omnitrophica bacterium]|nr:PD-(D/E)XK nuclease family protein [Candidatus Omnitrophota bacterium]